jgi:hypothetical protein
MRIANKREMYDLQRRGLLGNFLKTWTWREFLDSQEDGSFGFRHRTLSGSPLFKRCFTRLGVLGYVKNLLKTRTISEDDVVVSQDTFLIEDTRQLQGEVSIVEPWGGAPLTYAFSGTLGNYLTCREEVRQKNLVTLHGLEAKLLLERYMDVDSRDWLQHLLEEYPGSVTEFSCFSGHVGSFGWNTIFWETRNF